MSAWAVVPDGVLRFDEDIQAGALLDLHDLADTSAYRNVGPTAFQVEVPDRRRTEVPTVREVHVGDRLKYLLRRHAPGLGFAREVAAISNRLYWPVALTHEDLSVPANRHFLIFLDQVSSMRPTSLPGSLASS